MTPLKLLRICFWVITLSIASMQAYAGRYQPFVADSISYLDMADFIRRGELFTAVSSYWSPAYPLVVSFFLSVLRPQPLDCFAIMKVANMFILISTMIVFELFLNEVYLLYRAGFKNDAGYIKISEFLFKLNCYAVFAWTFLTLGGAQEDTPDYLLALFLLSASYFTIKVQLKKHGSKRDFVWLGISLGCAFMTKSFAAVLCPIFVIYALHSARRQKNVIALLGALVISFAVISLPYTIMVKAANRTSTIMSAAKLNYLWTILDGPAIIDDYSPDYAHLKHPPELIFKLPKIYFYAKPIPGTFPLWYDVGYWSDGVIVRFNPRLSAIAFAADWSYYVVHFLCFVFYSWFVVAFVKARISLSISAIKQMRLPLTIALAALFCYSVVVNIIVEQPQTQRYFPCFTTLLFIGMLGSIRLDRNKRSIIALAAMTAITLIYCSFSLKRDVRIAGYDLHSASHEAQDISLALTSAGLKPGDEIALLANGDKDISFLKMSGLRMVATIAEPSNYWTESLSTRKKITSILKQHGIRAIIFHTIENNPTSAEYWQGQDTETHMVRLSSNGLAMLRKTAMSQLKFFDAAEGWQKVPTSQCYFLLLH